MSKGTGKRADDSPKTYQEVGDVGQPAEPEEDTAFAVPPQSPYYFTLWFRLQPLDSLGPAIFHVKGKLTLHLDDGTVTSDSLVLVLCWVPEPTCRPQPPA